MTAEVIHASVEIACRSCGATFFAPDRRWLYCADCKSGKPSEPKEQRVVGEPFSIAHFKRWAAGLELDTGDLWELEPFQEAFVKDWFEGTKECWLIVPEGNGKTTLMAAIGLYHCQFRKRGSVSLAASSREQAEIAYNQAAGLAEHSPSLFGMFRCYSGFRRITCERTGSRIQVKAADDRTGDGIIPTLCLVDELHRHRDLKLYRTWVGKLRKREGAQIVTISTAGEPGGEFETTREQIRTSGETRRTGSFTRSLSKGVVLHEWAVAPDADVEDMTVVKAANPLSHLTVEALQEAYDSPTMTLDHWKRFACNLPTRGGNPAVTEAEWAAARVDDEIPPGEPIDLGIDLAFKYDTTALVPLWWRDDDYRLQGPATILTPPRNGDSLDVHELEEAVIRINERNPVQTFVVDRSKAEQFAQWLEEHFEGDVVERAQTNSFLVADYSSYMEALRLGQLKHTGDPGLSRHVFNAVARLLPGGDTRFDRPTPSRGAEQEIRVIDALSAASMVHSEAELSRAEGTAWVSSW